MLRLSDDGAGAEVLWVRPERLMHYSHAVMLDGRVYCFGKPEIEAEPSADGALPPSDGSRRRGKKRVFSLLCLDAKTGKVLAHEAAYHPGHLVAADGMVYAVDLTRINDPKDPSSRENRKWSIRVRLLHPTADGFDITGEFCPLGYDGLVKLRDGEWESHVPPVIAEGRMFLKFGPLMAFDLRGKDYVPLPAPPRLKAPPPATPVPFPTTDVATIPAARIPALLKQLGSRLAADRTTAANLLSRPDTPGRKELTVRLAQLATTGGESAWLTQKAAADALKAMGPRGKPALPALQKALPEALARRDGTGARLLLGVIQQVDESAVEPVAAPVGKLLTHEDAYVQYLAAALLKRMGPHAGGQAGALTRAARSSKPQVRYEAQAALRAVASMTRQVPSLKERQTE